MLHKNVFHIKNQNLNYRIEFGWIFVTAIVDKTWIPYKYSCFVLSLSTGKTFIEDYISNVSLLSNVQYFPHTYLLPSASVDIVQCMTGRMQGKLTSFIGWLFFFFVRFVLLLLLFLFWFGFF